MVVASAAMIVAACAGPTADRTSATSRPTAPTAEITVAAASDVRPAFEELGRRFEADTGTKVTFVFGSSGQLKEQVLNGAPFDVFASADVAYVDEAIGADQAIGSTKATYAFGRIVVYWPDHADQAISLDALADPRVRNVAIANPEHAPYGAAAKQALEASGVYERVKSKRVLGENVSDTLRLATSGNADAAIVARSLVYDIDPSSWALVDDSLHQPIEQALVVTRADPTHRDAATAFAEFVNSAGGRRVMNRYGFALANEEAG